jgi:hypothetical protein
MDWWHEIGHALIAHKRCWSLKGWGQGRVYDFSDGGPVDLDGGGNEPDASAIGIWCQHVLGHDVGGARAHAVHHGWNLPGEPPGSHAVNELTWADGLEVVDLATRERVTSHLHAAGFQAPWDEKHLSVLTQSVS